MSSIDLMSYLGEDGGLYNCGSGLLDDSQGVGTPEDTFERVYGHKTKRDYDALLSEAKAGGATIKENHLGSVYSADIQSNDGRYYVVFNDRTERLAITHDTISTGNAETWMQKHTQIGDCVLYQRKLEFGIQCCGMSYFLVLPDHSMFVIDGGHPDQASEREMKEMFDFMYQISGTPEGQKLHVCGWFISHAHGDHLGEPAYFFNRYHDYLDIEAFLFNFPSGTCLKADYNTPLFREAIRNYFSDSMQFKLHTGESFTLGGAVIRVLYTHEDCVNKHGKTMILDFNSSSSVLQIEFNGIKVFFPGDIHSEAETVIIGSYPASVLKSDILQVAHHCYNSLPSLYDVVDAPYMVLPQGVKYVDIDRTRSRVRSELLPYATGCFLYNDDASLKISSNQGKVQIDKI